MRNRHSDLNVLGRKNEFLTPSKVLLQYGKEEKNKNKYDKREKSNDDYDMN